MTLLKQCTAEIETAISNAERTLCVIRCQRVDGHDGVHTAGDADDADGVTTWLDTQRTVDAEPDKGGKTPFELVDLEFVGAMARQCEAGLAKAGRVPNGWQQLDPYEWLPKYRAAILRHLAARGLDDSGESHYAGVAVGAMICAHFESQLRLRGSVCRTCDDVITAAGDSHCPRCSPSLTPMPERKPRTRSERIRSETASSSTAAAPSSPVEPRKPETS